jgi:branched-chain amino acid aminotransferase
MHRDDAMTHSNKFALERTASPVSPEKRSQLIDNPQFGRVFTDHMVTIRYSKERGWHDAKIEPRAPILVDPASAVLHYAQEIFEGMKAYKTADGGVSLFRPLENARRFQRSAERMAMPVLPEETFLAAVTHLVEIDRDWIPDGEGSLYLRPFMFATEVFLGVKPAAEYLFVVIASSVGAYFKGGAKAVTVWVSETYTRAASGGAGAAKCGGNYAASLVAQAEATRQGCDQVVFLDAAERRWIEELGGMNIFFVFDDGSLSTPPLGGTILPGITRASLLDLARDRGLVVREEPYSFAQWREEAANGRLREAFACGTAAVVTSIGAVRSTVGEFTIGDDSEGPVAASLRNALVGIQRGRVADPYGWVHRIGQARGAWS